VLLTELKTHHLAHVNLISSIVTMMVLVVNVHTNVLNVIPHMTIVLIVLKEELTIHHNVPVHTVILKLTKFVNHVRNSDVKSVPVML